ncbi:alanine racemase [alpha proteobacterium AAP81b]|nr:alanine racemase [alpha proteobacterium AAP81b]
MDIPPHAWLTIDRAALAANWQRFAAAAGPAACGAAIKADGYGLGARATLDTLVPLGLREVFVAHWAEVAALLPLPEGVRVAVLHGVGPADMAAALALPAVPVLVTAAQVAAWAPTGRPCDVMVDTGLNRLGLSPEAAVSGLLDGLAIDTLHSHLTCSEDAASLHNARQRAAFADLAARIPARRYALANSAGIGLGADYHFDLVRPGIGLYGGGRAPDGGRLAAVAGIAARILQLRDIPAGASVGYGATWTAARPSRLAVVALGYADGYARSLSNTGAAIVGGVRCPVAGRVSMDLTAFDVTDAPPLAEGDTLAIDFDLAATAAASGRSEYELLTGLGSRYSRVSR